MRVLSSVLVLISILAVGSLASANSALTGETATGVDQRRWTAILNVSATPKTVNSDGSRRDDQDAFSNYSLRVDYTLTDNHSLRLLQGIQHNYQEIDTDQAEFAPGDTLLTHIWKLPKVYGVGVQWFNTLAVPLSQASEDNEKITHWNTELRLNKVFGRSFFSVRPYARYLWYRFKNTQNGAELPAGVLGVNALAVVPVYKKLSFIGFLGYTYVAETNSALRNGSFQDAPEQGRYFGQALLNYDFSRSVSAYVGYSAGDQYIQDGRFEIDAFDQDPKATRYFAGMSLTY